MSDQSRRSRPLGAAAAPRAASPAIAVVIALLAAVVGFFILKQMDGGTTTTAVQSPSGDVSTPGGDAESQDSVTPTVDPLVPTTPTPTVAPVLPAINSFKAIVANGSGVKGSAASMSAILTNSGMSMAAPTNMLEALPKVDTTTVYFEPGADLQAQATANLLGCGIAVAPMPVSKPIDPATMAGAVVLIVQGKDLAATSVFVQCTGGSAATPTVPVDPVAAVASGTTVAQ